MKRCACTARAAARTRSSGMGEPRRMLPAMVPLNRCTSCSTIASDERSSAEVELADVDAVERHPAGGDVVEARQQADDGGLAGPGRAHERDAPSRLHREADVAEDEVLVLVGERDVLEGDASAHRRQPGRLRGRHHARLRVEQREDALGGGHGRLQDVELLRQVRDGPPEALGVLDEGHERTHGERARQHAARRRRAGWRRPPAPPAGRSRDRRPRSRTSGAGSRPRGRDSPRRTPPARAPRGGRAGRRPCP